MNELTETQVNELLTQASSENIERLESRMLAEDQVEIPVEEAFVNGMYVRRIMIPAGTLLTGRVHKWPYVDIMLDGDISVVTPDGQKRLTGHNVLEGVAGRKRAGYAHADTHWVSVHRTDLVEDDMHEQLTFFSVSEYAHWQTKLLEATQ